MTDLSDAEKAGAFVTYRIKVPERRQLEALRDIEYRLAKRLREVRAEAVAAIAWAEQNRRDAPRYARILEACDDALEFQRARKRQARTRYLEERGTGLERWDP